MGTIVTILFVSIEARSDMFKIENLCRRPHTFNTNDIGIWATVLEVMSYVSVVSNLFLFAFSSDQGSFSYSECSREYSFIGAEHVVICVLLFLRMVVSDKPSWVSIFLKREKEHKRRRGILMTCAMKFRSAVAKSQK